MVAVMVVGSDGSGVVVVDVRVLAFLPFLRLVLIHGDNFTILQ